MEVVTPSTIDDLATVLRDAAATGASVDVRGAGTKSGWGAPGRPADVIVDTTSLNTVVEHAEADLVVTVQAGTRLGELQRLLAGSGQWLALDPPEVAATVGGVVAAAASGPRRLRYGTPRDLLIGITVVLVDGIVARSGGKVVKNVAGYDLGKLFTGSFGTLGIIASCTFRLHPLPAARRVVSVSTEDPAQVADALARSTAEPAAVEWDGRAAHVLLETAAAAADPQAAEMAQLLGSDAVTDVVPASFGRRPWQSGDIALKVTHRLSCLGPAVTAIRRRWPDAAIAAHLGSGVLWAGWPAAKGLTSAELDDLRAVIASYDGTVVVVQAPPAVKDGLDVWGPVSGFAVMERIKERFDPDGRMRPGRFVGGL
ncbi:MAG: glycolate oxidase binding subunit [Frankiaceae bacterium]|jgi:glycolate oxidase FAD binding subunit|nr:glycolate oxidase binding subunit [Frankiaceae bacterium]